MTSDFWVDQETRGYRWDRSIPLGGTWRVAATTERGRRTFHEFDHDNSGWATTPVPGHWAQGGRGAVGEDLAREESVLYRRRFEGPSDAAGKSETAISGKRRWLRIEGLAQQGDVWLDGLYLGHSDGYFVPHELEVTEQIGARTEHLLAIDATCRRFGDPDNRTTLTGALQDPELCGSDDLIV